MLHSHEITIPFEDADPAGIVFFARYFNYAHQAIEAMAHVRGIWEPWFQNPDIGAPLVHVSADYSAPLLPGKKYNLEVSLHKLGETSLSFCTTIKNDSGEDCAQINTSHVFVDGKSGKKIPIPEVIKNSLDV